MKSKAAFWSAPLFRVRMWSILAMLALLVMETIPIALWYQAVFKPPDIPQAATLLMVFAILGASHLLLRCMAAAHWPGLARQTVFLLWLFLAAFASLKLLFYPHSAAGLADLLGLPVRFILNPDSDGTGFTHLVVIALLVWRGISLAREPVQLSRVQASFQIWLAMLLLYGMVFALLYPVEAALGLYGFLFCGLLAMSAARIAALSELRGGRIPRFGFSWMAGLILSGLAVVGLAILAGWFASGQVVYALVQALTLIIAAIAAVVFFLLSPLLNLLAEFMIRLASIIQQILDRLRSLIPGQQISQLLDAVNQLFGKIIILILASRGLVLFGGLALLILVILLALYLRSTRERLVEEEETGSAAPGEAENPLQKMLRRLLSSAFYLRTRRPAQVLAAARIRRIYRQLMALSKKMGAPRPASVTPLEFLPTIAGLLPEESAGLEIITRAYVAVRYGEYPETGQELAAVEEAWEHIRREINRKGAKDAKGRTKKI